MLHLIAILELWAPSVCLLFEELLTIRNEKLSAKSLHSLPKLQITSQQTDRPPCKVLSRIRQESSLEHEYIRLCMSHWIDPFVISLELAVNLKSFKHSTPQINRMQNAGG